MCSQAGLLCEGPPCCMGGPRHTACPSLPPLPYTSLYHWILGPVPVQTLSEPEPDLKFSSVRFGFGFMKNQELDPKSSSQFREIYPELD